MVRAVFLSRDAVRRAGPLRTLLLTCVLLLLLVALLPAAPAFAAPSFWDVDDWHPYSDAIEDMYWWGVIDGYADGRFGPYDSLWRQHFAKMVVNTLGIPVYESDYCRFWDVDFGGPGTLYPDNYIAVAEAYDLIRGYSDGSFRPYNNVTLAQVMTMVVRAGDAMTPGGLARPYAGWYGFMSDWRGDPAHGRNMEIAEYNGLLDGMDLLSLDPYWDANRGECAQMLWNLVWIIPAD